MEVESWYLNSTAMQSIPDTVRAQLSEHYDIERQLVGGGMAHVFLAQDRELSRQVVIKVLPPDVASGVSASRFRSEILTVAKLQHPHIVGILRAGEVEGIPFFVMPSSATAPLRLAWACARGASRGWDRGWKRSTSRLRRPASRQSR